MVRYKIFRENTRGAEIRRKATDRARESRGADSRINEGPRTQRSKDWKVWIVEVDSEERREGIIN